MMMNISTIQHHLTTASIIIRVDRSGTNTMHISSVRYFTLTFFCVFCLLLFLIAPWFCCCSCLDLIGGLDFVDFRF
jgi:hypothetical protein